MESENSESSGGENQEQYESGQHEDSQYNSRDSHEAEEHNREFDERNENLEARVQKHSKGSDREIRDGELVIIYHESPDGRIEAFFEEKPKGSKAEGKLAPLGGETELYDIGPKSTAKREIREEIASKDAINEVLNSLEEDGELYYTITGYDANGNQFKVYIRSAKVKSDKGWEKVKKSQLTPATSTDLTGYARVLPLDEIIRKSDKDYAYNYGPIIKNFFKERHPTQYRLALYDNYTMPLISTKQTHLQAMEDIINSSLISVDRSMPNLASNYQNTAQKSSFHKPLYTN